jgi:hypothetical protein
MTESSRGRKLVQTSNHDNGNASLRQISSHKKIYKRSATLLTVLLCSATFAALDASGAKQQDATPKLTPVDSSQQSPAQRQDQQSDTIVSSPSVSNNTTSNTSVTSDSSDSSNSSTTVTVNGKSVTVPANGSYQQTTTSNNGSTSVNVDHSSSSTGSGHNNSSTNISVNTQSGGG